MTQINARGYSGFEDVANKIRLDVVWRHPNFQTLANFIHDLGGGVTGYVELRGQANNDPASPTKQASLDLSVALVVLPKSPNLQLDAGTNPGLTPATPKAQVYIGISQRY